MVNLSWVSMVTVVGTLAVAALELSPTWYTGGGGRSKVSSLGKAGKVNLARFLSGRGDIGVVVVVVHMTGGVGGVGIVGTLKVEVTGRTLFLAPTTVFLRGNMSKGSGVMEVLEDGVSVDARVTCGGAKGNICGVGAVSSDSNGSVSSSTAKGGNTGTRGTGGTTTLVDMASSKSVSEEISIRWELEDMILRQQYEMK